MRVPLDHPFLDGMVHYKPSIFGVPPLYGNISSIIIIPIMIRSIRSESIKSTKSPLSNINQPFWGYPHDYGNPMKPPLIPSHLHHLHHPSSQWLSCSSRRCSTDTSNITLGKKRGDSGGLPIAIRSLLSHYYASHIQYPFIFHSYPIHVRLRQRNHGCKFEKYQTVLGGCHFVYWWQHLWVADSIFKPPSGCSPCWSATSGKPLESNS